MKAIQVTNFGGPEKLAYTDVEDVVVGKKTYVFVYTLRELIRVIPIH